MWLITGSYEGCEYGAFGDDTTATVPEWLWNAIQLNVVDRGGILELLTSGPVVKIEDLSKMKPSDVVSVLESVTTIDDVLGQLPPRQVFPVFGDTLTVQ